MSKRCPFCRTSITSFASVCPGCQRELLVVLLKAETEYAPLPTTPAPLHAGRRRAAIGLSVVAVGTAGWLAVASRQAPAISTEEVVLSVTALPYQTTAADLYANFTGYEAATRQAPARVGVELTGTVQSVERTILAEAEIHLDAGDAAHTVTVTLDQGQNDAVPALSAGQFVTIRCHNMSRVLNQPTGQNCQLIDPSW